MTQYEPQPGDAFLTQIGGALGLGIRAGQAIAGDLSRYTHAGIVLPGGRVIAGQPGGARIDPIGSIIDDRPLAFLPLPEWADRQAVCETAEAMRDWPYGWLSYLWIGLARVGLKPRWLRAAVGDAGAGLICSAFVDEVWRRSGVHLFDDGRLVGEVTPGDLAHVGTVHHYGTGPYPTTTH